MIVINNNEAYLKGFHKKNTHTHTHTHPPSTVENICRSPRYSRGFLQMW